MSTVIVANQSRLSLVFMLYMMMVMVICALMFIRQPTAVRAGIEAELKYSMISLGTKEQYILEEKTQARFKSWVHDSGLYNALYTAFAPARQNPVFEEAQKYSTLGVVSESWIWRMLENFQLFAFQVTHRYTLMQFWIATMIPLMLCIVITGRYHRKIRQYQLVSASTTNVRIWLKMLWYVFFLFSIYLITPNIFGFYTFYAPPAILLIVALSISFIVANFTKT